MPAPTSSLLSYPEIATHLRTRGIDALVTDYAPFTLTPNTPAGLIRGALFRSRDILATHPGELAPQLIGRLLAHRETYPDIRTLLRDARATLQGTTALLPSWPSLDAPGGPLLCTLGDDLCGPDVMALAITPDGCTAISGTESGGIDFWDLASGRLLRSIEGPGIKITDDGTMYSMAITALAITPDGRTLASGSRAGTLKLWKIATGELLRAIELGESVFGVAITPDGRRVLCGLNRGSIAVMDLHSGARLATLEGHAESVTALAITQDGCSVVSASADHTLKVWELASGRLLRTLSGHQKMVSGVAITPDGCTVVSCSHDGTTRVWELGSGALLHTLDGHFGWVTSVAVTPDGRMAVAASQLMTMHVWDLASGELLRQIDDPERVSLWAVAVAPDGRRFVSGSNDGTITLWDLDFALATTPRFRNGHGGGVKAVALTGDGCTGVSTSWDRQLALWDVRGNTLLREFEAHEEGVNAVTFSGRAHHSQRTGFVSSTTSST